MRVPIKAQAADAFARLAEQAARDAAHFARLAQAADAADDHETAARMAALARTIVDAARLAYIAV